MNKTLPKFKIGDVVRVRDGVTDPDDPTIDWSGWHGRIVEVSGTGPGPQPWLLIGLDSVPLRSLSAGYIEQCEEEGMDWSQLYLFLEDMELATPRDTPWDVKRIRNTLGALHG